jgi:hypothetical protein
MKHPNDNGLRAFDTLARYLEEENWSVERIRGKFAFKQSKTTELCPVTYYFQVETDLEQFLFYIVPEISLFHEMLGSAAEYICRANFGIRIGNFELDFRDGQVRFKSSINFKRTQLSEILIDDAIKPAVAAFDEFFPGLANVIAGLDTPAKAIAEAEYGQ